MLTVLIADDEHHVCTYITALLQSQNWDLDIHTAYSGTEVLEAIGQTVFHLMLLDIDMPGATGLEVAKEVHRRYPRTRILFLTAYDNFDYIYSAVSLNCSGYLLKIEPEQVILNQIQKVIDEILEEQKNMARIDEIHRKDLMLSFLSQQTILTHICSGQNPDYTDRETHRISSDQPINPEKPIYLMYTHHSLLLDASAPAPEEFLLQRIQLMRSLLCDKLQFAILRCDARSLLYFFQPTESVSHLADFIFLRHVTDEFISTLSSDGDIIHETAVLYLEPLSISQISEIFPLLKRYGDNALSDNGSYVTFIDRKGLKRFSQEHSSKEKPVKNEQILKLIEQHIEQHYASKLTLSSIAELVNYNESYISRLFKKETGKGVIEYITSVRLQKAKELLVTSKATVQDIAIAVGFETPQYFSSLFRKQEGVTPTEYRIFQKKPKT